jgi:hypothetical protein
MTTFHRRYFLSPRRKVICKSLDLLLAPLHRPTAIATPSRILVSNIGHLGDLVIAGSVAPILKQHYPQAIIGYLVSSYSQCVLEENPYIDQTHLLDHWVLNRTPIAKPEKKRLYRIMMSPLSSIPILATPRLYFGAPESQPESGIAAAALARYSPISSTSPQRRLLSSSFIHNFFRSFLPISARFPTTFPIQVQPLYICPRTLPCCTLDRAHLKRTGAFKNGVSLLPNSRCLLSFRVVELENRP